MKSENPIEDENVGIGSQAQEKGKKRCLVSNSAGGDGGTEEVEAKKIKVETSVGCKGNTVAAPIKVCTENFHQLFLVSAALAVIALARRRMTEANPMLCRVKELLKSPSKQIFRLFGMDKDTFLELCNHFKRKEYLKDDNHFKVEEKMIIFLATLSHSRTNTHLSWVFQHSNEVTSKYFHEVLGSMIAFAREMIVPPDWNALAGDAGSYRQLRGPFNGAVGALDGTLIHAIVPEGKQNPYQPRGSKDCYQKVLSICDFDMKFLYIIVGYEGTAHDSRVLTSTIRDPQFKFPMPPDGKYYLCDGVYIHTKGFMTPYRKVRYSLGDYERSLPTNRNEKFNQTHAQIRNVIERAFGVLKARFPVLQRMVSVNFRTQARIVRACMALHNFIRRRALNDELFKQYERPIVEGNIETPFEASSMDNFKDQDKIYMVNLRDHVADQLVQEGEE